MAPATKRAKTETLSLRLDPKTKFMLDFMARVQGQSITTVVERAIQQAATGVVLSQYGDEKTWATYWDASEGVRMLNLLGDSHYPTNFDEDELLSFAKTHWPFFYTSERAASPRRAYVDILWPKIDHYLTIWREQRLLNYWSAGEAMKADIESARVAAPDWPIKVKAAGPREEFSSDLDDEIPF